MLQHVTPACCTCVYKNEYELIQECSFFYKNNNLTVFKMAVTSSGFTASAMQRDFCSVLNPAIFASLWPPSYACLLVPRLDMDGFSCIIT